MIYCDGVHLISDVSVEDLHHFAGSIGLKRCWFHSSSRFPHYDLPKAMRNSDIWFSNNPKIKRVDSREIYFILREAGLVKPPKPQKYLSIK